jgi:hypothetical protein
MHSVRLSFFKLVFQVRGQQGQGLLEAEFNPVVTAVCRKGIMTITVDTELPFYGKRFFSIMLTVFINRKLILIYYYTITEGDVRLFEVFLLKESPAQHIR